MAQTTNRFSPCPAKHKTWPGNTEPINPTADWIIIRSAQPQPDFWISLGDTDDISDQMIRERPVTVIREIVTYAKFVADSDPDFSGWANYQSFAESVQRVDATEEDYRAAFGQVQTGEAVTEN